MPARISDPTGSAYYSTIAKTIPWAAEQGAKVANVSFGGLPGSSTVRSAAQYMKDKGGLVLVAAGNSNIDEGYASTTTMIPVSATDNNDAKASWSSFGSYVAIAAPGTGIWTTQTGGSYGAPSGTLFASPVTTGTGGSLSDNWNTRKTTLGSHTIHTVAKDTEGNFCTASVTVQIVK